jgi:HAAS domain-containing protein
VSEAAEPIEAYLDELVRSMSTRRPRELRYLIAEAEAHLRDDAERGVAAGLSIHQAEAEAVARFGPARDVVAAEQRRLATPLTVVARASLASALFLGAIGALAIGLSGLIALIVRAIAGSRALVDVGPGRVLSASDCARWLNADSGARSCRDAAVADWVTEIVGYRLLMGVLGVVALAVFVVLRRRWIGRGRWATLPAAVTDTIAVTLFGAAGVWTLGMGISAIANASGRGSGQWLSAAPVALGAAAVFAVRLIRDLRNPAESPIGQLGAA